MEKGQRVLIVGGSRGIGRRIAEVLASDGCRLGLAARGEEELAATAAAISASGSAEVFARACDVSDGKDAQALADWAAAALGGIDALVNCAAIPGPVAPLDECEVSAWARTIQVNLMGIVNCCHAVLPHMRRQGHGRIINLAGGGVGWRGFPPGKTAYITSKFAVCGFTEALAADLGGTGISVLAVSPGSVDTGLRAALLSPAEAARRHAPGELSPDPAARLVSFLVSPRAPELNGKLVSAHWDSPGFLEAERDSLAASCRLTLRKIDDRNYVEAAAADLPPP